MKRLHRKFREEAARAAVARQAFADKTVKARKKLFDAGRIIAEVFCSEEVERRARFSWRWTDRFLEDKFPVGVRRGAGRIYASLGEVEVITSIS